jgi:hypothetical protein
MGASIAAATGSLPPSVSGLDWHPKRVVATNKKYTRFFFMQQALN